MFKHLSLISCALIILSACNKADTPLSRQEELRNGKWKVTSGSVRIDPFSGADVVKTYADYTADCKEDDYLVFLANYDGEQNSGSSKCGASDAETVQFRWQLFDNDKGIYLLNANETFFEEETIKADFINYATGRFTIRHTRYVLSPAFPGEVDTLTFTETFTKF
jgi:hypothetical protein